METEQRGYTSKGTVSQEEIAFEYFREIVMLAKQNKPYKHRLAEFKMEMAKNPLLRQIVQEILK